MGVLEGAADQNSVDGGACLHVFGVDHLAARLAGCSNDDGIVPGEAVSLVDTQGFVVETDRRVDS